MKKLFALCWLLLVGCAQNTPSSPIPIQPNTNWSSGTLENGLKYHLYPMDSNEVSMQLLIRVGSGAEEPHQLWYAHYVEHLAFEGSENFTSTEIERLMQKAVMVSMLIQAIIRPHMTLIFQLRSRSIRRCFGLEMWQAESLFRLKK